MLFPVPALCISWIDASLLAKDSMYKTTRGVTKEMYFTDDGFPVGIAYCLAILKQVFFLFTLPCVILYFETEWMSALYTAQS